MYKTWISEDVIRVFLQLKELINEIVDIRNICRWGIKQGKCSEIIICLCTE